MTPSHDLKIERSLNLARSYFLFSYLIKKGKKNCNARKEKLFFKLLKKRKKKQGTSERPYKIMRS